MSAERTETESRVVPYYSPGSYRELLVIAVPLMLSAATQSLMHIIDRIFLAWHSQSALAAALPAGILYWTCLSLPFGIASYVNTFVAQYDGAGKPDRVAASVWQGIYFALAMGGLLMLAVPFSHEIFNAIGHGTEIAHHEAVYFGWLCLGGIPAVLSAVLSAFYSGRGQTWVVLAVNSTIVAVSAVLDYAFIFGWGPIPGWGIAGAAMTDVIGTTLGVVIFLCLILSPANCRKYPFHKAWRFDRTLQFDLFKFGGPNGLQMFIDVAGFAAFMMIIGWIGERELAATNIAFNLNTLAFIPVIGMGIAVSTLVGQRIGEGRPELATASTWKGFFLAGGYMLAFGAIYTLLPDLLIAPYSAKADAVEFESIHETVIILLRFVAVYSVFDAMVIVFGSAIRGAGDTRFAMCVSLLSAGLLLVLPTYSVWKYYGPNLFWSWSICAAYVMILGFIYLARFQQGKWRSMNVIHRGEKPSAEGVGDAPEAALMESVSVAS